MRPFTRTFRLTIKPPSPCLQTHVPCRPGLSTVACRKTRSSTTLRLLRRQHHPPAVANIAVSRILFEAGEPATAGSNHTISAVLNTPELLEQILAYIKPYDLIANVQRTCHAFKSAIATSPTLQKNVSLAIDATEKDIDDNFTWSWILKPRCRLGRTKALDGIASFSHSTSPELIHSSDKGLLRASAGSKSVKSCR